MATILQVRPAAAIPSPAPAQTVVVGDASLVGRKIGSYTVLDELGHGGMGRVYLAEHTLIGRKAAIKVLNPDIATDPEVVSRFFTEARAVNDIRHPNIVEVTDFGTFDALYCIVMEYLEGETLAARMDRIRCFDEPSVVRIMKQCTSALGAAHEQGLVHRDIKPENIFLRAHPDYPDFVKLLDFGIAKLLGPESSVGHHTKTGSVMGTPSYMSPEQCLGESALDIRSDVYSLGVVIYQMLTGLLPFTGDTLGRLIVCHVSEPPVPPSVVNATVSRAMNDLVLRAMQKKPKDRFQSARDMREALERVLAPHARVATPIFGIKAHGGVIPAPAASDAARGPGAATPAAPSPGAAHTHAATAVSGLVRPQAPPARRTPSTSIEGVRAPAAAPAPLSAANPGGEVANRLVTIALDRIAQGQVDLPDLPGATIRCIELASNGRLGFSDAANIIAEVPSIRSRVMRLANSAAFPSLMPATTLDLSVARLGTQGLFSALIEFAAHDALEGGHPRVKEIMRRVWPHALGTAVMAADLCHAQGRGNEAPNGYLAGLLAQIGKPVVGHLLLEIEKQMQRAGNRAPIPNAVFAATIDAAGALAGGAVARHWDLPGAVVTAVEGSNGWNARDPLALSNLVRFADTLTSRLGLTVGTYSGPEIDRAFGEGRALLRVDEMTLKRVGHGFKERMVVLAGIRG
ncbi:MAG: protein kinase [Pseudomonadota bacterium]